MYVIVEGIDGCGKDSHAQALYDFLESEGQNPLLVAEPYEMTETGKLLRKYLREHTNPEALFGLFIANRFDLQHEVIKPALDEGRPVISVRGFPSTLVYQQDKYGLEYLFRTHQYMPVFPTHVAILDVDVSTAMKRIHERGEVKEVFEKEDFLKKCRRRYLDPDLQYGNRPLITGINNMHLFQPVETAPIKVKVISTAGPREEAAKHLREFISR